MLKCDFNDVLFTTKEVRKSVLYEDRRPSSVNILSKQAAWSCLQRKTCLTVPPNLL